MNNKIITINLSKKSLNEIKMLDLFFSRSEFIRHMILWALEHPDQINFEKTESRREALKTVTINIATWQLDAIDLLRYSISYNRSKLLRTIALNYIEHCKTYFLTLKERFLNIVFAEETAHVAETAIMLHAPELQARIESEEEREQIKNGQRVYIESLGSFRIIDKKTIV